jgi:succinate dehydrogenase / fumarate reductase flavoprotein subunit
VDIDKIKNRAAKVGVTVGNREYNPGWNTALDLKSLLIVSEAVARAGLDRTESRGAHSRLDYQASDPKQERIEIAIKKDGNEMKLVRRQQPDLPPDLKKIIEEGA